MKKSFGNCRSSLNRTFGLRLLLCLLLVLGAMTLSGCSTVRVKPDDLPPIPANLLTPCPPLGLLTDGKPVSIAKQMLEDARMYQDCRDKHRLLTETVKFREQILNQED